ncbi:MAG: hypothetical protein ABSG19_13685 [Candidatus Aminicenantales bacterium]
MKKPADTALIVNDACIAVHCDSPRLLTFHSFSMQLLHIADMFYEKSAGFEKQHLGEELTGAMILEYQAEVTAAIFSAWFFFEATINEFFWAAQNSPSIIEGFDASEIKALSEHIKDIRKPSSLCKYSKALEYLKKKEYSEKDPVYDSAKLLSNLRNALVHFVPEWTGTDPRNLVPGLTGKISLSPLFGEAFPFFPHRCLSADCARWSLRTVCAFVDDFYERIGIKPRQPYLEIRSELKALKDTEPDESPKP